MIYNRADGAIIMTGSRNVNATVKAIHIAANMPGTAGCSANVYTTAKQNIIARQTTIPDVHQYEGDKVDNAAGGDQDTANADTANADTANADTANADTANTDTANADTANADTANTDTANVDSANADTANTDNSANTDSANADTAEAKYNVQSA
ncbi:uncharacterized protein PFL1_03333 [Pseudozyma flocculosa PF-1]|uniref:Uncharacterized protein n=1 Tax=Pseudozyma flocculosa PF-1 TaxID=1277687 RepID=A0A061H8W2_9BASI|nr:uncharacterized protein PFL1_03333 [Pseudozyma flocculosa PF-1]EPQ29043.1 hypothetical protein PFL1_03333 [Pseudozyma flocculosa PF-1]